MKRFLLVAVIVSASISQSLSAVSGIKDSALILAHQAGACFKSVPDEVKGVASLAGLFAIICLFPDDGSQGLDCSWVRLPFLLMYGLASEGFWHWHERSWKGKSLIIALNTLAALVFIDRIEEQNYLRKLKKQKEASH